jgi:HAD superfamily hydrolase (TIGR01509 family)
VFAVGYALDGILVTAPDVERTAFRRLCAEVSADASLDAEAVERAFDAYAAPLTDGAAGLNAAIADAVQAATKHRGREVTLAARYRQIARQTAAEIARPMPDAKRVVDELRSVGVMQGILANGLRASTVGKATAIGFDGKIVASEDVGFKKPNPQAFGALIDALALPPQCIWYLASDFETDIEPARAAGLNAVWLTDDKAASPPAIRRIEEFLDVVQEPYTRSLLGLRYIMHNTLQWRPGHFVPGEEYGLGG